MTDPRLEPYQSEVRQTVVDGFVLTVSWMLLSSDKAA